MGSVAIRSRTRQNAPRVRVPAAPVSLKHTVKELPSPATQKDKTAGEHAPPWKATDSLAYQRDVWERTVLFWDTLRQRANNMLEHERAGLPPLLDFKSETLLDARRFERPVNYALL